MPANVKIIFGEELKDNLMLTFLEIIFKLLYFWLTKTPRYADVYRGVYCLIKFTLTTQMHFHLIIDTPFILNNIF